MGVAHQSRWSHTTPLLWFSCLIFTFGDLLFGIDTGSFGSLQALPSFLNHFGENINGKKALSTNRRSTMNSVVWIGKITGTAIFEPILERYGFKITTYIVVAIQILGVVIELTAKEWIQFSVGRVLAYLAVGMVENVVPAYTSEISPIDVRGFFTGSLPFFVVGGNLWGAGMSRAFVTETSNIGWQIPTAVQLIPAVVLLVGVPFTPESPRWLLSKGKREQAQRSLDRVRPKGEVEKGLTALEIEALQEALEESRLIGEGKWSDLFRGTYLRRTFISAGLFLFQQSTGVQFINSYLPTFLTSLGLGSRAFTYTVINNAAAMGACAVAMYLYDTFGRRPIEVIGAGLQVPFMFAFGALASTPKPTESVTSGLVASFVLYSVAVRISHCSCCWIMTAEMGGIRMRKKIMGFGTSVDVVCACIWTVSVPYMLTAMGPKVGYFFGSVAAVGFIFAVLFVPELKGRSLEETDELFEQRLWAWQFDKYETHGIGRKIARLEAGESLSSIPSPALGRVEADRSSVGTDEKAVE